MKARLSSTWLRTSSDSELDTTTHAIISGMTGNAAFPTPAPPLAAIQSALAGFNEALGTAKDGGKAETAAKNAARLELAAQVRTLGQYIEDTADGNLEHLLSSKFPLQKERAPLDIQPAPANLRLKQGRISGSAVATCEVVPHRVIYEWQHATGQNPTDWLNGPPTNSARTEFNGFPPGTWLNVRARVRVPAGAGNWSGITQMMLV